MSKRKPVGKKAPRSARSKRTTRSTHAMRSTDTAGSTLAARPTHAAQPPHAQRTPAAQRTSGAHSERIELDPRLSIVQATELHRSLLARLAVGGDIVVDGSRVEEIDTSILQLLTSLWRTGRERGVACSWHGASNALRQTATLVGVAEMLRFPEAESAHGRGHVTA